MSTNPDAAQAYLNMHLASAIGKGVQLDAAQTAALVAEVERLRGERAAVVAWLREHGSGAWLEHGGLSLVCLDEIADKFERGEHRREEGA